MRFRRSRHFRSGFLLPLMAAGLVVMGSTAAVVTTRMEGRQFWGSKTESITDLNVIKEALIAFQRSSEHRLPCVAPRNALPGTATYGQELTGCATGVAATGGTVRLNIGGGNYLRIGALPHITLKMGATASEDKWGNRFTYAVIEKLTDSFQFSAGTGAITIQDNAGGTIISTAGWVVVSHGPDGKGAYGAKATTIAKSCTATQGKDQGNCLDNDAIFRIADLENEAGTNFFDDIVAYAPVDAYAQTINMPCAGPSAVNWAVNNGNGARNCSGTLPGPGITNGASSAVINNTAGGLTGSATFTCNNGVLGQNVGATCRMSQCAAVAGHAWGGPAVGTPCTANIPVQADGGSTGAIANTTGGYSGTTNANCNDGVFTYTESCNSAGCPAQTFNWGAACTANVGASANGATPTINNTTANYTGSNTLLCNSGAWSVTGSSCTYTPPDCTATTLGWGAGCSANPGAMTHGQTINNVSNTAVNYAGTGNFSCNAGTMSVTGNSCVVSCSDGFGLSRSVDSACPSGYSGTASTPQTRASCASGWVDGAVDTSGCALMVEGSTCTNGASNYPTCSFAYVCTNDHQINGVSDTVTSYQSDTDDTGTTGDPSGPSGGDVIACCLGAACPAINGTCSDTPMACDFGDPINDGGQTACGTTHTWTCQGENGGTNTNCSIDNQNCTTSCSATGITGYASARVWNGPISTPTYNICTTGGVPAGNAFILTTDTAGSSWHAEVHKWNFTQGVASTQTYMPYDRKKKSTLSTVVYDGSCSIYATAQYRKNSSNFKYAQIALTSINSCPPPVCTATGLPDDGNCCRPDFNGDGLCGGGGGGGGGGCFLGDTKVILEDGSTKEISKLELGERIQGKAGANTVRRLTKYATNEPLYSINNGRAFVTGEHPFVGVDGKLYSINPELTYVETHHGLKPNKLVKGTSIVAHDSSIKVDTITSIPAEARTVYNVSVDGDLSYFADGYLMHNVGSDGGGFLGKAMVRMADGQMKPLSEIVKGDKVQGHHTINSVEAVQSHYTNDDVYNINNGTLLVAGEHLLMTSKGWAYIDSSKLAPEDKRNYRKLVVGDILVLENNKTLTVDSIKSYQTEEMLRGLALDGDHTYYVNGALVHNVMMIEK